MGGWATVSVRTIDEAQEAPQERAALGRQHTVVVQGRGDGERGLEGGLRAGLDGVLELAVAVVDLGEHLLGGADGPRRRRQAQTPLPTAWTPSTVLLGLGEAARSRTAQTARFGFGASILHSASPII